MLDVEKQDPPLSEVTAVTVMSPLEPASGSSSVSDLKLNSEVKSMSVWQKFNYYNMKLETMMGIEARGIERVPEDQRHDTRLWGNLTVWLSANCVLPTFGVGILGPLAYNMHLGDSMLTIFFFGFFASMLPAFMSTFGPRLGLRQMTSSRFAWGYYGAKAVAFLNCVACVGWATANTIAGSQTLVAVSDWTITPAVGTVIIAMGTLVIGMFGYKHVHRYEQFAWVPTAVTFFVLLGVSAKHMVSQPMAVGSTEAAAVLSFGGIIWGYCLGWSSLASDYNVYMPADAPSATVFMWTYIGIAAPVILVMWLGAAIAAAALAGAGPEVTGTLANWNLVYKTHELGGLLYEVMVPPMGGGGKFFMVLLVLSVVANNVINVYSMGMSISVISRYLEYVPRMIWPVVITAIYIPIAIVGADSFAATLKHFLSILGYWLAIFVTVIIEEHFIFRKGKFANYDAENAWNNKSLLPIGFGGLGAFLFGVAGAVVGMAQIWFTGPLGEKVGGAIGGDIGFELASGFAGVTYPLFRWLEIRYIGR